MHLLVLLFSSLYFSDSTGSNLFFLSSLLLSHISRISAVTRVFFFRFADDIDGLAGEEELAKLVERLNKASKAYGMEISAEKTKLMSNNTSGINTEIKVNG